MKTSRIKVALAVMVMIAGVVVGAVPSSSDPALVPAGQEGKIPDGDWTPDQIETLLGMIDEAETVLPATYPMTATYEELSTTLGAMGYHDFGIEAPGGYAHWINNDLLDGDTLDPARVESLVYQYDYTDNTYRLVSAMYMLGSEYDVTSVPADLAWLPGWHAHDDLCATPDLVFAGFAPCFGSSVPLTQTPMMHVWIVDTACGHRFGGVDQGGLHCEVTHHDPGDHDPGDHDPGDHDPGEPDHGGSGSGEVGGAKETGASSDPVPVASAASPVAATPTYTG